MSEFDPTKTLVWLDLETTGLDPAQDAILEIAVRVSTDGHFKLHMFVNDGVQAVVRHDGEGPSPFIREMHTKNGLLPECALSELTAYDAEALVLTRSDQVFGHWPAKWTLAGSSVHFDLGFLRRHMPVLANRFSHKLFGVSAIKLFCQQMGMPPLPKAEAHRAMADVEESFDHWHVCRNWVMESDAP